MEGWTLPLAVSRRSLFLPTHDTANIPLIGSSALIEYLLDASCCLLVDFIWSILFLLVFIALRLRY